MSAPATPTLIAEGASRPAAPKGDRPLRLLVGYDGRGGSRDALSFASALGESTEVELTVASVRPYRPGQPGAESRAMVIEEDEHWVGRGAAAVLGSAPFATRVIAGGHQAEGLKELAEAEGSDMIVVGSSHSSRIGRVSPGKVGRRVLDGAPCAVAVAPRGLADTEPSIRTIAVGFDGSQASATALRRAIGLAERTGASLLVLGAIEISLGLAGFETRQPKDFQRTQMERHLQRALESVPPTTLAESKILYGDPTEEIVEAAAEADLLVLGSRGSYGPATQLVLGEVGAGVVKSASTPTLFTVTD